MTTTKIDLPTFQVVAEDGGDIDLDTEEVYLGGERLTEEQVNTCADEAERRGRPSLSRAGASPRVAFRVSAEVAERLDAEVARTGRSTSEIAREALEAYLAETTPPATRGIQLRGRRPRHV